MWGCAQELLAPGNRIITPNVIASPEWEMVTITRCPTCLGRRVRTDWVPNPDERVR